MTAAAIGLAAIDDTRWQALDEQLVRWCSYPWSTATTFQKRERTMYRAVQLPGPTWLPALIQGIGHEWAMLRLHVGHAAAQRLLAGSNDGGDLSIASRAEAQGLRTLYQMQHQQQVYHCARLPDQWIDNNEALFGFYAWPLEQQKFLGKGGN